MPPLVKQMLVIRNVFWSHPYFNQILLIRYVFWDHLDVNQVVLIGNIFWGHPWVNKMLLICKIEGKAMIRNRYNYPKPPIRDTKEKETQTRNN